MENKIREDLKQAQLSRDAVRVSTLRLLLSEIANFRIQKKAPVQSGQIEPLSDDDIVQILQKEAKKRKESIESFKKGGREDLASKEEAELAIIGGYLPRDLSNEELTKMVEDVINNLGAKSLDDSGRVIGAVMGQVKGRADGGRVSSLVREKLS